MSRSKKPKVFEPQSNKPRIHRYLIPAAICVTGMLALLYGLGSLRLASHEVYVAVPVREMLATGDFITPRYGGLPRLEKPPLVYWLAAISAKAFGGVSEWTMRVPSVLAAFALAIVVGIWARRWYGEVAGWGAAAAQLTALYVVVQGRRAEVDMQLCLLTTTAMFLIGDQCSDERQWPANLRWSAIYLLLSLSWLAKFHYGPAMVLVPTVLFFVLRRNWQRFRGLLNPVGVLTFIASVVTWPLIILNQTPSVFDLWKSEAVGRVAGELGRQPVWFYVPCILIFILPWTPYAIAGAGPSFVCAWKPLWIETGSSLRPMSILDRIDSGDAKEQFLWIWFAIDLVLITLSANKNRQYSLAILPMCSVLIGQQISALCRRVSDGRALISIVGAISLTVLMLLCGTTAYLLDATGGSTMDGAAIAVISIAVIGVAAVVWLSAFRQSIAAVYGAIATHAACVLMTFGWLAPVVGQPDDYRWMNSEIHESLSGSPEITMYRMSYHPWYYDADFPLNRIESQVALTERLRMKRRLYVLTSAGNFDSLKDVGNCQLLTRLVAPDGSDDDVCLVDLNLTSE